MENNPVDNNIVENGQTDLQITSNKKRVNFNPITLTATVMALAIIGSVIYVVTSQPNPVLVTNSNKEANNNNTTDSSDNQDSTKQSNYAQIATGFLNTCAISSSNFAYCWGDNILGALGNSSGPQSLTPINVDTTGVLNGKTISSITIGMFHTCAIASDGKAYCWGSGAEGALGDSSSISNDTVVFSPVAVDTTGVLSNKTIKSIKAGVYNTCVVASDDKAYCWGNNVNGQLGNGLTDSVSHPVAVDISGYLNGKTILTIAPGRLHTCAIASDHKAYCWGDNQYGQLGDNSTNNSLTPVAVYTEGFLKDKTLLSIGAGDDYTCAIASDHKAYCWGSNGSGQLGNGDHYGTDPAFQRAYPVAVDTNGYMNGKIIQSISVGSLHTCAIDSEDRAYCWGYGKSGELGDGAFGDSVFPVAADEGVLKGKNILSISAGSMYTCAITSNSETYCWGYNNEGQLGNNSIENSSVPVAVKSL